MHQLLKQHLPQSLKLMKPILAGSWKGQTREVSVRGWRLHHLDFVQCRLARDNFLIQKLVLFCHRLSLPARTLPLRALIFVGLAQLLVKQLAGKTRKPRQIA
jgi:hypothetical protein